MTTALAELPDTDQLQKETSIAKATAADVVVDSHGSFENAGLFLVNIKTIRKNIAETFDHLIKSAHDQHKSIIAEKKKHDTPLNDAERIVKLKMGTYTQEQERIARQEQQRKEREAREAEETRRLAEAEALEKEGRTEEAEQLIEEPIHVPVAPPPPPPKAEGVSMRKTYSYEISDESKIPRGYMVPNSPLIGSTVRNQHEAAETLIPGIKVNVTTGVSARSA